MNMQQYREPVVLDPNVSGKLGICNWHNAISRVAAE
jgi:hypothetical protein